MMKRKRHSFFLALSSLGLVLSEACVLERDSQAGFLPPSVGSRQVSAIIPSIEREMDEPESYQADVEFSVTGSMLGSQTFKFHIDAKRLPDSSTTYSISTGGAGNPARVVMVDSLGRLSVPSFSGLKKGFAGKTAAASDAALLTLLGRARAGAGKDAGRSRGRLKLVSVTNGARFHALAAAMRSRSKNVVAGDDHDTYSGVSGDVGFEVRLEKRTDVPLFQRMQFPDGRILELTQAYKDLGAGMMARTSMSARMQDGQGEKVFGITVSNLAIEGAYK